MNERYLLVLWLTGRCNLSCRYCYASAYDTCGDMSFETAKAAIDKLSGHPLKIQFAGGEPLLNFYLAEQICQYVRRKGIDAVFQLQTNGTLLNEVLAAKLKAYSISVGVSLDGVPEVNSLTRGQTVQAVNGIRLLGAQGITIGLNTVVTAWNVEALPKLVDFSFYLGNVGGIGLDLLRYAGRGLENQNQLAVSSNQIRKALKQMVKRSQELYAVSGRKIQIREIELAKKRLLGKGNCQNYCYASCGRSVVVLPNGELYPCGSLITPRYYMGSIDQLTPDRVMSLEQVQGEQCSQCRFEFCCPKGCPSRRIRNGDTLDCVLLKTSFELAETEIMEEIHNENSN